MPSFVPIARLGRVEIAAIRERSKRRCALLANPISVRTGLHPPVRRLIDYASVTEDDVPSNDTTATTTEFNNDSSDIH
eukprot:scaffold41034_cov45-Attheya_sp.AAC.4